MMLRKIKISLRLLLTFTLLVPTLSSWAFANKSTFPKAHELPSLQQLEKIVLKRAGLDPSQIRQWQKGARWAAALPRIQVGWESKFLNQNTAIIQDSISVTSAGITVGPESNRVDQDFENNQDFEVKAVWALDELLFNREQLSISREARDLFFVRTRIMEELHQAYYDLKSLLLAIEIDPTQAQDPLLVLKVEQKIDKLNSLTGGEFKTMFSIPTQTILQKPQNKFQGDPS